MQGKRKFAARGFTLGGSFGPGKGSGQLHGKTFRQVDYMAKHSGTRKEITSVCCYVMITAGALSVCRPVVMHRSHCHFERVRVSGQVQGRCIISAHCSAQQSVVATVWRLSTHVACKEIRTRGVPRDRPGRVWCRGPELRIYEPIRVQASKCQGVACTDDMYTQCHQITN